ncbi:MAG: hypothetical protein ACKO9A_08810, partial [Alphaproteobacteria bacterium]
HDYFGGRTDLAQGVVRFVGDPETRLAEDYLRLLRFFRFHARYGKGAPDAAALQAIRAAIPGLERLSVERVWMEIKRILMVAEPVPALRLMAELGVLPAILSEIAAPDIECVARLVALGAPAEPLLRLAALGGAVPGLAARLKFSLAEARALRFLQESAIPDAGIDTAAFRRWRAAAPHHPAHPPTTAPHPGFPTAPPHAVRASGETRRHQYQRRVSRFPARNAAPVPRPVKTSTAPQAQAPHRPKPRGAARALPARRAPPTARHIQYPAQQFPAGWPAKRQAPPSGAALAPAPPPSGCA